MADVLEERRDQTLWLTIDREDKRNSLSRDTLEGLLDGIRMALPRANITAVVIASAGDRVFCAGADLSVMTDDSTGLEQHESRGLMKDLVIEMRNPSLPS